MVFGNGVEIAELRIGECRINEQVDAARRKVEFPVGTRILDQITDQRYRVGISPESYPEEADRQIADVKSYQRGGTELPRMEPFEVAAEDAIEKKLEVEKKGKWARWLWAAVVGAAAVLAVLAAAMFKRKVVA